MFKDSTTAKSSRPRPVLLPNWHSDVMGALRPSPIGPPLVTLLASGRLNPEPQESERPIPPSVKAKQRSKGLPAK
eukprot:1052686-Karenia_brevis.AAC.1